MPSLHRYAPLWTATLGLVALSIGANAQEDASALELIQRSGHAGTMQMPEEMAELRVDGAESIVFEPYQMTDDLYDRHDLVFLMRGGPSDWSQEDQDGVALSDCSGQRSLSDQGVAQMRALGAMMGIVGVIPGEVVASDWCRTQQTVDAMIDGFAFVNDDQADAISVASAAYANQMPYGGTEAEVAALLDRVQSWEGHENGPLLIVTHFNNIQALTEFNVYEGEMLVLDPTLGGRVLGYLRLTSAEPDIIRFDPAVVTD